MSHNRWMIEPVFENGEALTKGFLSDHELQQGIRMGEFKDLGFQSAGWINGTWRSFWRPIIPMEVNNLRGPAELWGCIASNLFTATRAWQLKELKHADQEKFADILDDRSVEERLAQAISLSLRSMDHAVEQIAEHYNEQLVNRMYSGEVDGMRSSNTMDQNLFAHVHSFFLQLGSARDYLAAFISNRLGMNAGHGKVDTMNALKSKLRANHVEQEPLLGLLVEKGWLVARQDEASSWDVAGWLTEITELRNEIVHRRPYGSVYAERFGWVVPVRPDLGLYRYFRPIQIKNKPERDLLDTIDVHYSTCTALFFEAAKATTLDTTMVTITGDDIVSLELAQS